MSFKHRKISILNNLNTTSNKQTSMKTLSSEQQTSTTKLCNSWAFSSWASWPGCIWRSSAHTAQRRDSKHTHGAIFTQSPADGTKTQQQTASPTTLFSSSFYGLQALILRIWNSQYRHKLLACDSVRMLVIMINNVRFATLLAQKNMNVERGVCVTRNEAMPELNLVQPFFIYFTFAASLPLCRQSILRLCKQGRERESRKALSRTRREWLERTAELLGTAGT